MGTVVNASFHSKFNSNATSVFLKFILAKYLTSPRILAGLLSSGLIPAVSHALHSLMTSDSIVLPASATVFVQVLFARVYVPITFPGHKIMYNRQHSLEQAIVRSVMNHDSAICCAVSYGKSECLEEGVCCTVGLSIYCVRSLQCCIHRFG